MPLATAARPGSMAAPGSGRGVTLDLRQVSHQFDLAGRQLPVLEAVDLHGGAGEFVRPARPVGLRQVDPVAAGRGLEPPASGQVLEDSVVVAGPDPSRILVFQDPTLFPWRTVRQNVALGLQARGLLPAQARDVDEALALVRLEAFRLKHLPPCCKRDTPEPRA